MPITSLAVSNRGKFLLSKVKWSLVDNTVLNFRKFQKHLFIFGISNQDNAFMSLKKSKIKLQLYHSLQMINS